MIICLVVYRIRQIYGVCFHFSTLAPPSLPSSNIYSHLNSQRHLCHYSIILFSASCSSLPFFFEPPCLLTGRHPLHLSFYSSFSSSTLSFCDSVNWFQATIFKWSLFVYVSSNLYYVPFLCFVFC